MFQCPLTKLFIRDFIARGIYKKISLEGFSLYNNVVNYNQDKKRSKVFR